MMRRVPKTSFNTLYDKVVSDEDNLRRLATSKLVNPDAVVDAYVVEYSRLVIDNHFEMTMQVLDSAYSTVVDRYSLYRDGAA